jgi:hypothetical protein
LESGLIEANKVDILSITAVLIMVVGGFYSFWKRFIVPKLTIQKLRGLYALVGDWFDRIDQGKYLRRQYILAPDVNRVGCLVYALNFPSRCFGDIFSPCNSFWIWCRIRLRKQEV